MILVGTENGLKSLNRDVRSEHERRSIGALAIGGDVVWAVADGEAILRSSAEGEWGEVARSADYDAMCLLPTADGLLVGTAEAHLLSLVGDSLEPVDGFESTPGRDAWFTPWGGPPATRSLDAGAEGEIYANVHVGGIPRSDDGTTSWTPTIEVGADVHEVKAVEARRGWVLAATAWGYAASADRGATWEFVTDGLDGSYSRAVALAGDTVLLTASQGPRGGRAAIYRRPLDADGEPFERCRDGLPEWFDRNIDTACVDAGGNSAAFGVEGSVYASRDAGRSWELVADDLPPIHCLRVR